MSKYPIGLWRIPAPVIKSGKYSSLIVDSGDLKKAIPDSNNNFLFAESSGNAPTDAIKPLAFIGTLAELTNYLIEYKNRKVITKITSLDKLYIGISKYKPKERFTGVFPLQDVGIKLFSQLVSLYPDFTGLKVPAFAEAGGIPNTLKDLISTILKLKTDDDNNAKKDDILFLKISYLPEEGMTEVKSSEISFASLLNLLKVGDAQIP